MNDQNLAAGFRVSGWVRYTPVLTLACMLQTAAQAQQAPQVLHKHVRSAVSSGLAPQVGFLPSTQQLNLVIHLPVRNQDQLTSLINRLSDPASPDYHKWLSVAEFTERFGRTNAEYQKVADFAEANGLAVSYKSPNRLMLVVGGSVERIAKTFNVQMRTYQHPTENRIFYSADREPSVALDVPVSHISGLNNYAYPHSRARKRPAGARGDSGTGSGPGSAFLGSDMRTAYNMGSNTGVGQTVGLLEFSGYSASDVSLYFSSIGQTNNVPIQNIVVDGGSATSWTITDNEAEVCLDIDQVVSVAPGLAQLRVYIGPTRFGAGVDGYVLSQMATDNIAKQLSNSWYWSPDDPATDDPYFEEMATQGQTFFNASGDYGAYIGSDANDGGYPAEDTHVTVVGGTGLTTSGAGGPWQSEVAWNNFGSASGGGPANDGAAYFAIPSWQMPVINLSNGGSTTLRNSPDVAMQADFYNYICFGNGTCGSDWGGTSFAAPRWAAWLALVNQQVVANGHAAGLGFINPTLYSIGQSASYDSDFHDITSGNNYTGVQSKFYNAVVGYDLVTGWGSPNGQSLMNALAGTPASCSSTSIDPYLQVGTGALQATNTVTVSSGSTVNLSPQPLSGGSWSWAGPNGYTSTSREIDSIPLSTGVNTYVATYTNAGGCKSTETFTITVSGPQNSGAPFITGQTPGPLRNNYSGFVGFQFAVGSSGIVVSSLGRFVAPGNSGTHLLKLVQANGVDLPNGSVSITINESAGQYQYAALASPVSLLANTNYFLVSQETTGGDQWYDIGSVTFAAAATVLAPTYTDGSGRYVAVAGLPGQSYVPVNFLYSASTSSAPTLSVSITLPQNGATLSGSTVITVSTSGSVANLQLQVDGVNYGAVNVLTLDTTQLTNGTHVLTVIATDSLGDSATSAGVTVTVNNSSSVSSPTGSTAFVTGQSPGPLRNNYLGFVGFSFTTGTAPVAITSLGRYVAPGNSASHLVKLVDSSGNDVPGGSVSISLAGSTAGQFLYLPLAASVTLTANTMYYLVSQEVAGGDEWYDIGSISVTTVASVNAPVYTDSAGRYVSVAALPGEAYVPLSFLYGSSSQTSSTSLITSQTPSTLRNNYTGFVGTEIKVGATALTVTSLGRLYVAGNNGTHTLKLVQGNGTDLPGGTASLTVSSGTAGQFQYATLAAPITLQPNTAYYLVSQETAGGDLWYDLEPVTSTSAAQILGPIYSDGQGNYVVVPGLPNYSYVPVNLQYH